MQLDSNVEMFQTELSVTEPLETTKHSAKELRIREALDSD
jgi:hypothetical protein